MKFKKILFFFVILFMLISCSFLSSISLSEEFLNKGGNILVLSFFKDNPDFFLNGSSLDKQIPDKKIDLTKFSSIDKKNISNKQKFKFFYKNIKLNEKLMKYFINFFQKRLSSFKINYNLEISKNTLLNKLLVKNKTDIDKNFKTIKNKIKTSNILEIRVIHVDINDNITNPEGGFFNTYGAVLDVKGILYDIDKNKKIWESILIRSWTDLGSGIVSLFSNGWLLSSLGKNNGKKIELGFNRLVKYCAEKLVNSFFEKKN